MTDAAMKDAFISMDSDDNKNIFNSYPAEVSYFSESSIGNKTSLSSLATRASLMWNLQCQASIYWALLHLPSPSSCGPCT